jgi:hypothetical protein
MVQYCQNRVYTVPELQTRSSTEQFYHFLIILIIYLFINRLSEMGYSVGQRVIDSMFIRDKNYKREIRLINMLVFIRTKVWMTLFGKEADKLEQANDDETTC